MQKRERNLLLATGLIAAGIVGERLAKPSSEHTEPDDRVDLTDRAHDEPKKKDEGPKLVVSEVEKKIEKEQAQPGDVLETELREKIGVGLSTGFDMQGEYDKLMGDAQTKLLDNRFRTQEGLEKYFGAIIEDKGYRKGVLRAVQKYCKLYDVPISVATGVIGVESGGDNDVESEAHAKGLFQVKSIVLEELARVKFNGEEYWRPESLDSVDGNTEAGIAYIRYLYNRYGQWGISLMAFRLSPGAVENMLLERINQHNLDAFAVLERVADLRDDSKAVPGPKIWTKEMVKEREWRGFLSQRGINATFICSEKGLDLGAEEGWAYPFPVEATSDTVMSILESDDAHPEVKFGAPREQY